MVTVRLHDLIKNGPLPDEIKNDSDIWKDRYDQICNWEKYLYQNGFHMIKIFLHVSKDEQRQYWDRYQDLYSDMLYRSSTKYAPWYVLPADNKWFTRLLIAMLVRDTLRAIDPQFPELSDDVKSQIHTVKSLFEDVDMKDFGDAILKLSKSKKK